MLENRASGEGPQIVPWDSLSEMLPGVVFHQDGQTVHATDAVVSATVESVTPGHAIAIRDGRDTPVPWDSQEVAGRFAYLHLSVHEVLCGKDPGDEATLGLLIDDPAQIDAASQGFQSMGNVVVFLTDDGGIAEDVYSLSAPGAPFATTGPDDVLTFPGMQEGSWHGFLDGINTMQELRTACPKPSR